MHLTGEDKPEADTSGMEKKKQKLHLDMRAAVLAAVLLSLLFTGCQAFPGGAGKRDTAPEYVLTYAENQTSDYPTTMGARRFAELVKSKSDGRIVIEIHANAELGEEISAAKQLVFGGIDMERASLSTMTEYSGTAQVLQLPYLYAGPEHMWKVLNSEIGQEIMDSFDGSGIVPLSWYDAGARSFYTTAKPIRQVSDLRGMRIRVQQSPMMEDMIRLLGATPVPSTYKEVYSQLQKGDIDGAENNVSSYETMKHYEIARYFTDDEHMRVPELQIISQSTWDKLSEDDRKIIRESAKESAEYERKLWNEQEKTAEQKVREAGTEFIELTPEEKEKFRDAMLPLYEKYCGEYTDLLNRISEMEKR